ncbi:MAG: M48 family metallopeptidase [Deltaproteobacteria bacterium]|nr:M48 family metallopeptidase [Candidatus Zymogenaceae bacterium]
MNVIAIDKIIRSDRKSIGIEIGRDASLIVRAPKKTPMEAIEKVVSEKQGWIVEKQQIMRQRLESIPDRKFTADETFPLLGKEYPLFISENAMPHLSFSGSKFMLKKRYQGQARRLFFVWYRKKAAEIIPPRVEHYARLHSISYKKINISWAANRWGSASSQGTLNFSWRLIMAPITVIDYVVVHELAHLVQQNHSRRFWDQVSEMCPNFQRARQWLVENGHTLTLGRQDVVSDPDRL